MKKKYTNPTIETMIVSPYLMGNMDSSGDPNSMFAPKRQEDKPF